MKWIKASERQPEDWGTVLVRETGHVRSISEKYKISVSGEVLVLESIDRSLKYIPLKFVEWLDESTNWIEELYLQIQFFNPYKQSGNRESYSKYNEGWSDACCEFESKLEECFEKSKKIG